MNILSKCPICDGLGYVTPRGVAVNTQEACPKCNGTMVMTEFDSKILSPMSIASGNQTSADTLWRHY